jgi:hypothetical protein
LIKIVAERILEYKALAIEVQSVRNRGVGNNGVATSTIPEPFRQYLSNVPGKH